MRTPITAKTLLQRAIEEMPDEATMDEALQRLYVALKVERGLTELEAGKGIDQRDIEESLEKWLE
jgi:hypothetical protein